MPSTPIALEFGAVYELIGADGTRAVLNNPRDPDFAGFLAGDDAVTGLERAGVRENADALPEADGGVHGAFRRDRLAWTLKGFVPAEPREEAGEYTDAIQPSGTNYARDPSGAGGGGAPTWNPNGSTVTILPPEPTPAALQGASVSTTAVRMTAPTTDSPSTQSPGLQVVTSFVVPLAPGTPFRASMRFLWANLGPMTPGGSGAYVIARFTRTGSPSLDVPCGAIPGGAAAGSTPWPTGTGSAWTPGVPYGVETTDPCVVPYLSDGTVPTGFRFLVVQAIGPNQPGVAVDLYANDLLVCAGDDATYDLAYQDPVTGVGVTTPDGSPAGTAPSTYSAREINVLRYQRPAVGTVPTSVGAGGWQVQSTATATSDTATLDPQGYPSLRVIQTEPGVGLYTLAHPSARSAPGPHVAFATIKGPPGVQVQLNGSDQNNGAPGTTIVTCTGAWQVVVTPTFTSMSRPGLKLRVAAASLPASINVGLCGVCPGGAPTLTQFDGDALAGASPYRTLWEGASNASRSYTVLVARTLLPEAIVWARRQTRLRRAAKALRTDGVLRWTTSTGEAVQVRFREQQPIRFTGRRPKQFLIAGVSERHTIESQTPTVVTIPTTGTDTGGFASRMTSPLGSDASVVGAAAVENRGDDDAWPVLTFTGPMTNPSIRSLTAGREIRLVYGLADGETLVVDTAPGRRTVLLNGNVDRYDALDWAGSRMFPLMAGTNDLRIGASSFSAGSSVTVSYRHAWG